MGFRRSERAYDLIGAVKVRADCMSVETPASMAGIRIFRSSTLRRYLSHDVDKTGGRAF